MELVLKKILQKPVLTQRDVTVCAAVPRLVLNGLCYGGMTGSDTTVCDAETSLPKKKL